jgi:Protein of unknown function (DUF3016)
MRSSTTAALLALVGMGMAHAAGTVKVSFIEPDKFVDAGNRRSDTPATLKALEQHFHTLGQRYLPDGQTLTIEVLDVDLAGSVRFAPSTGTEVRVYKGNADWPRIKLRYTLDAPGQEPRRGEELLKNLSYEQKTARYSNSESFRYEKQMLDQWFKARFAPKQP